MEQANFLDTTLRLSDGKFWPYKKPNDMPLLYINVDSNHPPNIIRELPKMIGRRISSISCDQEQFDKAKQDYDDALKASGYKTKIEYSQAPTNGPKPRRSRNTIWFNPPHNQAVKTDIGRLFLRLIDKHFPRHHKFRPIFNRNTVKISYSCMPNMGRSFRHITNKCSSNPPQPPQPPPRLLRPATAERQRHAHSGVTACPPRSSTEQKSPAGKMRTMSTLAAQAKPSKLAFRGTSQT